MKLTTNESTDSESLNVYMRDVSRIPIMTTEEECEVAKKSKSGDASARQKLIIANLRFVVSVARNYQNQGVRLEDLINIGNIGLIKAAAKFEPNKNFKFISYAVWWIRQAILQELASQSRIVQYPLNRVALIHKVGKVKEKLKQSFHREPIKEEIAEVLCKSIDDIDIAIKASLSPIYFDKPLVSSSSSLLEVFCDEDEENNIEQSIIEKSSNVWIEKLLHILTDREREIIRMYYGLGHDNSSTLEEIGTKLNITRERVRQLKDKALETLKHHSKTKKLKENL